MDNKPVPLKIYRWSLLVRNGHLFDHLIAEIITDQQGNNRKKTSVVLSFGWPYANFLFLALQFAILQLESLEYYQLPPHPYTRITTTTVL